MDSGNESVNTEKMDCADGSKQAKDAKTNLKRKFEDSNSFQKKEKLAVLQQKNALMQLNELMPGLAYSLESRSGPSHDPLFKMSVLVNGKKYIGRGNSKQLAKHAAAQSVLSTVQFRNISDADHVSPPVVTSIAMDNARKEGSDFIKIEKCKNGAAEEVSIPTGQLVSKTVASKLLNEADKKNAVSLLCEIFPGVVFDTLKDENLTVPNQRFCVTVEVNGQTYEGTGQTKKVAKVAAACSVLSNLYQISYNTYFRSNLLDPSVSAELLDYPQTVADNIAKSLMSTFKKLKIRNPEYTKWKVIAGIAITKDPDMNDVQIITIGTGTKSINDEHISMVGASINDCHAEIISRRCLKDFFYTNLELILKGKRDESIFVKREKGGFSVKPCIKFHLYISTAPCGDARIFFPYEEGLVDPIDRHSNHTSCGILRTKLGSTEGTVSVKGNQVIQTLDKIFNGQERLLTMSCSDKIASWNVLGLQGALLSYFIEPVYLESVILGGLFNSKDLHRSLFARFESHLKDLPAMFHLNKPKMCTTTKPEMHYLSNSPNFSVNWTLGLGCAEVVNATTGKTESGQVSRLSKKSFFHRFLKIYKQLSHIDTYQKPNPPLYVSFKNAVKNYKEAQKVLNAACLDSGLGCWVKKPIEQHDFE